MSNHTIQVVLAEDLAERIQEEALEQGLGPSAMARQTLEEAEPVRPQGHVRRNIRLSDEARARYQEAADAWGVPLTWVLRATLDAHT